MCSRFHREARSRYKGHSVSNFNQDARGELIGQSSSYHGKIQDHPQSFYMQFDIIIAGLDSISARRWINATLVQMVDEENPESLKPLIDGGTEGENDAWREEIGLTR